MCVRVHVYMCVVCECVCTCACMCVHVYMCTCMHVWVCICVCMHVYRHVCAYLCACGHMCVHVCIHVCVVCACRSMHMEIRAQLRGCSSDKTHPGCSVKTKAGWDLQDPFLISAFTLPVIPTSPAFLEFYQTAVLCQDGLFPGRQ